MTTTPQMPPGAGPAPMPPGMVPPGYVPAPPAKKPIYKRTWFVVLAALVVLGIIGSQQGGSDDTSASAGSDGASDGAVSDGAVSDGGGESDGGAAVVAGIGQPADDGKFRFVVDALDCSTTQIGNDTFGVTAQGKFCILDVTISNIGDEPQSFFGDNSTLLNAEGQKFSADSEAAIYLENSESLFAEINPGNTLKSRVVFDVPADMTPASVELHDSAFSGGVTVNLG